MFFYDQVASYRIIDARYVYEYKGGHIRGAENFGKWNEEAFMKEFLPDTLGPKELTDFSKTKEDSSNSFSAKRHILIFHCEFSSVRGPTLLRRLRKM
jgi:M-phase inducer phosphatase 2